MTQFNSYTIWLLALLAGCASAPSEPAVFPSVSTLPPVATLPAEESTIKLVDHNEETPLEVQQPSALLAEATPELLATPLVEESSSDGLTVEAIEQLALANNPAVGQASAKVRALRGKYVQVGLPPNPTVGYAASEIGQDGLAGQEGAYAGQEFITAGKLDKNRAIVAAEIDKAEQIYRATQRRVLTDVRRSYYRALVAQQRIDTAHTLLHATGEAVKASQDLLDAEEIPLAGLLQTEVEQQNAEIVLRIAENELTAAWQQLSAVVGDLDLPPQKLVGDPKVLPGALDWDETLARITMLSPEMAAAMAELSRSRRALTRANVEPVPDVDTQFMLQYDNSTNYTIGGIQATIPLPLWNKNQGGIRQAQAEITVASQNIDRVALDIKNRLATTFREYSNARMQAETYAKEILPRARKTFDLVQRGYSLGEVGYLDSLAAQKTYIQTNLSYLDALGSLWQSYMKIDGLLLEGSLDQPAE
ncbi:TolC family protein [Bythopirellula polymerisocia]|uniref:Cobalt-zinc-cadmium resistance protein CzcC n=1 Tax=Bythopirellula polymerisocia TaxID=2528003 RepID=A0A5C6CHI9_9BACT|nr:TolC family protein [Bythopirellula polymerisocia]TWU22741.1 Cobalt-zinc-cadmium resistance protein CzcC precursor [Bythopirellula polymerisocia]